MLYEEKDTPWINYMEVDDNYIYKLRDNTPDSIRKKYEEHLKKLKEFRSNISTNKKTPLRREYEKELKLREGLKNIERV